MLPKENGLSLSEAERRLVQFGPNVLPEKPPPSDVFIFVSQFKSPLVYILIAAFVTTLFLGEFADASIILIAVVTNTILGFVQERKAERALDALKDLIHPNARVVRGGKVVNIKAESIVPGDIVILSPGDKIPGDGILVETNRLFVSEAILTGESVSVSKDEGNKAFMGTFVKSGRGILEVVSTGGNTEIGGIALSIQKPEAETPLRIQLRNLAKALSIIVFFLTAAVFVIGLATGREFVEIFTTSVALAVSAIPEGLLVSLTVVLALGMQRILKKRGLVRNLVSAETLGGVTVICTDKTGTLTEGEMSVVNSLGNEEELVVQSIVANDLDDPIVVAAYSWAKQFSANWDLDFDSLTKDHKRLDSIPFSSQERFFASLNTWDGKNNMLFVNGAPEYLLDWSIMDDSEKKKVRAKIEELTTHGHRVVGMARKKVGLGTKEIQNKDVKSSLRFVGLLAFADPVRSGVAKALGETKDAGIEIIVITGDYAATATSVMRELGVDVSNYEVVEGSELEKMKGGELAERLNEKNIKIFARTTPEQKLKIIEALKVNGEVVAMMGDGVNDAPALRHADIGIVVGTASDVAKETANLVLLDSNYETILAAIKEGRGIFANIRKIILYLVSDAFEEIIAVIGAMILSLPLPVSAAQILWINLISDGLPNLALTVDPVDKDSMSTPPRPPSEPLFANWVKLTIAIVSIFGGIAALSLFIYFYSTTGDLTKARSVAFMAVGVNSLVYVFSIRTLTDPFWKENPLENKWLNLSVVGGMVLQFLPFAFPPLRNFFALEFPGVFAMVLVFGVAATTFVMIEITKAVVRRHLSWFQH